jgi:putative transcription factor
MKYKISYWPKLSITNYINTTLFPQHMPACDMCGTNGQLNKIRIEGTIMNVCPNCAKFGESLEPTMKMTSTSSFRRVTPQPKPTVNETVVENASQLIKQAREKLGLKQIDLSKKLNLRESVVQQFESGHTIPTIDIVKKFQQGLGITLISTQVTEEAYTKNYEQSQTFTIGDMIKKSMKKE